VPNREEIAAWLKGLQQNICASLEKADGLSLFSIEPWERPEGGGGITRVIQNGNVIERCIQSNGVTEVIVVYDNSSDMTSSVSA